MCVLAENDQGGGMTEDWGGFFVLLDVFLTLVVSLGAVGGRVGPHLRKFSEGKSLVQGRLAARHGQTLACIHFMPVQCI